MSTMSDNIKNGLKHGAKAALDLVTMSPLISMVTKSAVPREKKREIMKKAIRETIPNPKKFHSNYKDVSVPIGRINKSGSFTMPEKEGTLGDSLHDTLHRQNSESRQSKVKGDFYAAGNRSLDTLGRSRVFK